MPPEELTPREVAARIGATPRTVQRWIATGRLAARRVGGRWRVASGALDAFEPRATLPRSPRATDRPIRRLFVANRGEIARRIERSASALGMEVAVPGSSGVPPVDLLSIDAVVEAARRTGADALHPGYGFLAENADAAAAVERAGIRWVGPPPEAIRAMGDKAAARRLAASLDVPVVPGYDDPAQDDEALGAAAARIGVPVLVKPAAGGGGKGMRVVRDLAALPAALDGARREGRAAFGDDRLVLERLLEGPRHVEVQVLFDAVGAGVHLGERDCSLQRRHQKVLEESPSPAVDADLRARLGAAALRLAGAVGYRSAGTCEFLVDDGGRFFFLEMNTRLQVEHPVTELLTGRDLVADQLAVAAGATLADLGLDQPAIDRRLASGGHAIEVRLYAEDAEHDFLPATGRVAALRWPTGAATFGPVDGAGLRIDAGIEAGAEVGDRFDPMLAKLIAHGPDRAAALGRLAAALDATLLLGLVTNLRFLRWLVREPAVVAGEARIDTLDRLWPPDDWPARTALPEEAWREAAAVLLDALTDPADPWAGGWRASGGRSIRLRLDHEERTVRLADEAPPERPFAAVVVEDGDDRLPVAHLDLAGLSVPFAIAPPPDVDRAARAAAAHVAGGAVEVVAPMPGTVLAVHVAVGDAVEAGQPVAILEAMKMEHVVAAPAAGTVVELSVAPGDQVARGQSLGTVG